MRALFIISKQKQMTENRNLQIFQYIIIKNFQIDLQCNLFLLDLENTNPYPGIAVNVSLEQMEE